MILLPQCLADPQGREAQVSLSMPQASPAHSAPGRLALPQQASLPSQPGGRAMLSPGGELYVFLKQKSPCQEDSAAVEAPRGDVCC